MFTPEDADAMARLRAARPAVDESLLSPHTDAAQALVEQIVATEPDTVAPAPVGPPRQPPRARRPRLLVTTGCVVTVLAVGLGLLVTRGSSNSTTRLRESTPTPTTTPTTRPRVAIVDIRTIAARSASALGASGRAKIAFNEQEGGDSGTTDLAFSGHDVEMVIHFNGANGRPGFDAHNKTVDGQFYLYTPGPDNVSRWHHETNETNLSVFNSDPRTLLHALVPEARFVTVGHDVINRTRVTHLRATRPAALPALNLSLGPIKPGEAQTLDLWVGSDDVVRRLDLTTATKVSDLDPKTAPALSNHIDGYVTIIFADGHSVRVKDTEQQAILDKLPHVTITFRSSYSVTFSDVGAPVSITAPVGATDIAGKG